MKYFFSNIASICQISGKYLDLFLFAFKSISLSIFVEAVINTWSQRRAALLFCIVSECFACYKWKHKSIKIQKWVWKNLWK